MGRGGTDQLMAYCTGVCGGKAFADLPCTSFIWGRREAVELGFRKGMIRKTRRPCVCVCVDVCLYLPVCVFRLAGY